MKIALGIATARVASILLAFSIALPAAAVPIQLEATLDGAQANAGAGTGSPGTGSATMTFDTATNLFSWNITWQNLNAPAVAAHFHGPALPNQNAGVQVPIGIVSPEIGNAILTAVQAADLLAGLWYINIHTPFSFGGEIRGQVRVTMDTDGDGVPDDDDLCPDTVIPEGVPTVQLNPNHWALTEDGNGFDFDTVIKGKGKGPNRSYTIEDTAGCSCEQIIEIQGLGDGHTKHGCSISAMDDWVRDVNL